MLINVVSMRITIKTIVRAEAVMEHVVAFLNTWFGVVVDQYVWDITDEYEEEAEE